MRKPDRAERTAEKVAVRFPWPYALVLAPRPREKMLPPQRKPRSAERYRQ